MDNKDVLQDLSSLRQGYCKVEWKSIQCHLVSLKQNAGKIKVNLEEVDYRNRLAFSKMSPSREQTKLLQFGLVMTNK